MNYILNKYHNVRSLRFFNDQIYLVKKDGSLYQDDNLIVQNVEPFSYWVFGKYLFYHSMDGVFTVMTISDKKTLSIKYENFRPCPAGPDRFFMSKGSEFNENKVSFEEKADVDLFDFSTQKIIAKYSTLRNKKIMIVLGDHVFCSDAKNVFCINLTTDTYVWQYELQFPGYTILSNVYETKISSFLGYYKNHLLIALSNDHVLSISSLTGKLNWQLPNTNNSESIENADHFPSAISFVVYEETGKLFSFSNNRYIEIDIETGAIIMYINEYYKMDNAYKVKFDQNSTGFCKIEDSIFYTTRHSDEIKGENLPESYPSLARVDLKSKKVDLLYEFKEDGKEIGGFKDFVCCKNSFYLLGGRNDCLYKLQEVENCTI